MAVREKHSATLASAGSTIKNFFVNHFVGQTSTYQTTLDVLLAEHQAIWAPKSEERPKDEAAYCKDVQQKGQAALCLSGGGIRSAAFSLGVLQVLANRGLLTQFHYLSTVSGGGYIGGWLSRWIAEDPQQNAANIEAVLGSQAEILQVSNLRADSNFLTPKVGITSTDTWTGMLLWVRNVLLNWTVFIPALFFTVLAPNLYLAVMTWLAALGQRRAAVFGYDVAVMLLWIATISLTVATWQTVRSLPSHREGSDPSGKAIGWQIVRPLLSWAALVPPVLVAGGHGTPEITFRVLGWDRPILFWLLVFSFGAKIIGYLLAWITDPRNFFLYLKNVVTWVIVVGIATGALWLAVAIIDILAGWLPAKDHLLMSAGKGLAEPFAASVFALSILGPLGGTLAHLLLSSLYVGFRFAGFQDDADREWLARVSAVNVFPALLWTIFALICLFLPFLFIDNEWLWNLAPSWGPTIEKLLKALGMISGVISGFIAVLGGKSASSPLDIAKAAPKSGSTKAYELAVRIATLLFIAFLFVVLAYVERNLAETLVDIAKAHNDLSATDIFVIPRLLVFLAGFAPIYLLWWLTSRDMPVLVAAVAALAVLSLIGAFPRAMGLWVTSTDHSAGMQVLMAQGFIAAALFLITSVAAMKIDVNRFSMHGVYRNRLVRAFLGGARAARKCDPFTGFDPADNLRVSELKAQKDGRRVLYPVINVTLNLVGGENLAWQERKASAFIITPLYCGSAVLGNDAPAVTNNPRRASGAYIETKEYGGNEPDLEDDYKSTKKDNKTGVSLGTAITISGAAASPSMGYNSRPSTAFLMTLFNVRLGAWLANPAAPIRKAEVKAGPTSALKPLLIEALGLTDAKQDNVYLSDGGHFDNLGIYEMIRRRCRYILVVDADADEKFAFEDLARSVRFAAIDLDAKIEFESIAMKGRDEARENSVTFAIGKITYAKKSPADAEKSSADAEKSPANVPSWLIYLKPTYFDETAPVDVRSYGKVHPTFPHETTLDQWFGESQFESYRRLGEYLMCRLYDGAKMPALPAGAVKGHKLADFFAAVAPPLSPSSGLESSDLLDKLTAFNV
jgi:predicted acylesterase/phospholipase RssA